MYQLVNYFQNLNQTKINSRFHNTLLNKHLLNKYSIYLLNKIYNQRKKMHKSRKYDLILLIIYELQIFTGPYSQSDSVI
jgi:uncharacterized membrane protein YbaN (DUF454 family)